MAVRIDPSNWYRLEGKILPLAEYGKYTSDISQLTGRDIWYTNVEVRLQNASSINYVHGVNYKLRTFEQYGLSSIEEIAGSFNETLTQMLSDMAANQGAITYTEAFAVTKSSVICYDDAYSDTLKKYIVVLKDDWTGDALTGITAEYKGNAVAMGEEFNEDDLEVTGIFTDGHESRLMPGTYKIIRLQDNTETKIINKTGSIKFRVSAVYADETWTADFTVQGVKKLTGVTAYYDGPEIAVGKQVQKRYFIVTAQYSDGSASTVSDWSFYNGNTVTVANSGIIDIYYLGFTCKVQVKYYETTVTQIKAYYDGPDVEKGKDFLEEYLTVKIYSQDAQNRNGFWETLEPGTYNISTTHIALEGENIIDISYTTAKGIELTTSVIITGFIVKAYIGYITAEYTGPPVPVGSFYNTNLIIVRAYWTDGNVTEEKDFAVSSTKIEKTGDNVYTLSHKRNFCTFIVTGIAAEETTASGYTPAELPLKYPEASTVRHRYRGPMESLKFTEESMDISVNIRILYGLYNTLENKYNNLNGDIYSLFGTSYTVLNACAEINNRINDINHNGGK